MSAGATSSSIRVPGLFPLSMPCTELLMAVSPGRTQGMIQTLLSVIHVADPDGVPEF